MDFTWFPSASGWTFPLLCLLFMAIMMLACFGMRFLLGRRGISCGCARRDRTQEPTAATGK